MSDKKNIYKFFRIISIVQQTKLIASLMGIMASIAILEVFGIGCIFPLVQVVLSKDSSGVILGGIRFTPTVILLGTLLVFVLKNGLLFLISFFQTHILQKLRHLLSMRLFSSYLFMPYLAYLDKNPARLIILCFGEANTFSSTYATALCMLISELFVISSIFIFLIAVSPIITLIGGLFLVAIAYIFSKFSKKTLRHVSETQHHSSIAIFKSIKEGLESLKETRLFGSEQYVINQLQTESRIFSQSCNTAYVVQNSPRILFETLMITFLILGVLVSKQMHIDGAQLISTMGLFGAAMLRAMPSLNRITNSISMMRTSAVSVESIYTELTSSSYSSMLSENKEPLVLKDAIKVSNLSFTYPNKKHAALNNISFELKKGKHIGIVGKSGAGKTTLIDVLLGIIPPESGEVTIDGVSIHQSFDHWKHLVGYVPQLMVMLDDTIQGNIAFGIPKKDIDPQKIQKIISQVQLDEFIKNLPQGLDTLIGDRGIRISGGQRQRIAIARALYRDPEILIFDEATSSLDLETEHLITQELFEIGKDKTLIVIAHRLSTIIQCDHLLLIESGQVADQGTYSELIQRNKWFSDIQRLSENKSASDICV